MAIDQIYFVITRRCNLFCSHCIRSSGPGIEEELSLDSALKTLHSLSKHYSTANLLLSGGEPTLHKDFVGIAEEASKLFRRVTINTNGLREGMILSALERGVGNIGVQISIDGAEKDHDSIRGTGTFKRSMRSVPTIASQADLTIATTVTQKNIQSLKDLDSYFKEVPFNVWTLQREVIYGRASLSTEKISTQEWNEFVKNFKNNSKNKNRVSVGTMFDFVTLSRMKKNPRMNCGTFTSKFYINPDLTVFPCGCLEDLILADLTIDEADVIVDKMRAFQSKPIDGSPCSKCPFVNVCNGGCPGASFNYFGKYGVGDPRCPAVSDLILN
jgi:radical SAM protein with 4Fe4S-binding SPASM domain